MRVFTAGLVTETNTFAPWPTGLRGFSEEGPFHGDATTRGRESEMGVMASGWRDLCRERGYAFVEGLFAFAQPSGRTVQSVYEGFRDEILADLRDKGPFDMVLLFLHGAMASQDCDDCEGDILARVREIAGPDVAVGAELDPHCHLTPLMIEKATAIVLMKEYPHTDYLERGRELFDICAGAAQKRLKPVSHLFDCRMVGFYPTTTEPMRSLVDKMKDAERRPGVLSVSFGHGFPWGDTPETGSKVLVVADGDTGLASEVAAEIGHALYDLRQELLPRFPKTVEAIAIARQSNGCVVLADTADNAGGGAPSDNVSLLKAMLAAGIRDAVFGGVWDPVAVRTCAEAGIGATLALRIGGKSGPASGEPLDVTATVMALRADHDQQGLGPARSAMGDSVWIDVEGVAAVLMSTRTQIFAPDAFTGLGIDLKERRIIALKSSWHFQALFAPVADQLVAVATPGAIQMDFAAIDYRKKRDLDYFPRKPDPLGRG
ncbi:MAG TPA: M81 family metallopeptidase [Rhizomicrobium sp.]|jgi:microcystin degradation protein MlrC|nr:M81 family metallopeptidase [Rhizomicrobium sp.]